MRQKCCVELTVEARAVHSDALAKASQRLCGGGCCHHCHQLRSGRRFLGLLCRRRHHRHQLQSGITFCFGVTGVSSIDSPAAAAQHSNALKSAPEEILPQDSLNKCSRHCILIFSMNCSGQTCLGYCIEQVAADSIHEFPRLGWLEASVRCL